MSMDTPGPIREAIKQLSAMGCKAHATALERWVGEHPEGLRRRPTWVYVRSEPNLFTVGFYALDDKWHSDSDHDTKESAAEKVNFLNGNCEITKDLLEALEAYVVLDKDEIFGETTSRAKAAIAKAKGE